MLFKIENCYPADYEMDNRKLLAISNLLVSNGLKKNIVIAEKSALTDILESSIYGVLDKKYATEMLSLRREYGVLPEKLLLHLIIDFNYEGVSCEYVEGKHRVRVSYSYFCDPDNTGPVALLTENSLDFRFYNKIALYYASYIEKLGIKINFREYLGAGSHSKSEFDRLSQLNKIVLCLVDSDKSHPRKGEGSTSRIFSQQDRTVNGITLSKVIDVREVESILPIENIENVIIGSMPDSMITTIDEIKSYNQVNNEFRKYFDHKNGLSLKKAIELDNQHGEFWLDILSTSSKFSNLQCFIDKQCHECDSCPSISGFGDSLLERVTVQLERIHLRNLTISEDIKPSWMSIGELLMSWGCSMKGRLARAS